MRCFYCRLAGLLRNSYHYLPARRNISLSSSLSNSMYGFGTDLVPYTPPKWAEKLKGIPTHRIQLAQLDTPIHKWTLPGLPANIELYIKRDDMTGSSLSGNKVRKLEFLFADAIQKGCKHVITCGGVQSNHCRATAVAARQVGLQPHLVLRSENLGDAGCQGNMFLNKMVGADIHYIPLKSLYEPHIKPRMDQISEQIKSDTGEDTYHIPVGGSSSTGLYGYLNAFKELIDQGILENIDDIIFACGSGGTAEGLAVANFLTGSKVKIHGIAVCDDANYFHGHVNRILKDVGLTDVTSTDILDVIEGYKGRGYGLSTEEELKYILNVSTTTGIMLDPTYTGKAVKGMVQELNVNLSRFQGNRILFIHTGGIFGMMGGQFDKILAQGSNDPATAV